jgi:hypothetical protein
LLLSLSLGEHQRALENGDDADPFVLDLACGMVCVVVCVIVCMIVCVVVCVSLKP